MTANTVQDLEVRDSVVLTRFLLGGRRGAPGQ